jgi:hypothetical protein
MQRSLRFFVRAFFYSICLLSVSLPLFAQTLPPVSKTFAIQNAKVIQAPGRVIEKGTVLIENGVITAVGTSVALPFDVQIIKGDSLTVYAGFIDGLSHIAVPKPKEEPPARIPHPGQPTYERAGIQSTRDVRTFLKSDDGTVEEWRKLGFTAAHVVPNGQMLPGASAVILLEGENANKMVLKPELAQFGQFVRAANGQGQQVYPSNLLGIMAEWRQAFGSAKRNMGYEATYAKTPVGLPRPELDPTLISLYPVIRGEQPVAFFTEDAINVRRALNLSDEIGYKIMLFGLRNGAEITDLLKAKNAPLFLSLNLPEEPKASKDTTKAAPATLHVDSPTQTAAEAARLRARQAESRLQYLKQAAVLQQAGLTFGFITENSKSSNFRKSLKTMISNGLSEDQALAALTTNAAKLLGVDAQIGSVDKGKVANLVVTDGNYFDEKTNIRYVFVDGVKHEYEAKKVSATKPDGKTDGKAESKPESGIVGTWDYSATTPNGSQDGKLVFKSDSGKVTGVETSNGEDTDIKEVKVDGKTVTFSLDSEAGGQKITVAFNITVDGDSFSGTASIAQFNVNIPVTGKRQPK